MKVEQALEMIKNGGSLEGVILDDLDSVQISVRDALSFARSGIVIPEKNIYYDDEDIMYDREIDDVKWSDKNINLSWEEKAKLFQVFGQVDGGDNPTVVTLDVSTNDLEIDTWMRENRERLTKVIKPIIKSLFEAEKMIKE